MTTFVQSTLTDLEDMESWALGADGTHPFTEADVGKAVKLAASNNMILATNGDEIDGFVNTVEHYTVNSGFGFGGVRREGRQIALVGSNQSGTLDVGEYVVADTQTTLNTANQTDGTSLPYVKTGTPTYNHWRCIRIISGTGVPGDKVLLERI